MPYTDATGTLLIDENAAANDIAKLKETSSRLKEVKENLTRIMTLNAEMSGETASSIEEATKTFIKKIDNQISVVETAAEYINSVVKMYEKTDTDIKDTVNNNF